MTYWFPKELLDFCKIEADDLQKQIERDLKEIEESMAHLVQMKKELEAL